MLEKGRGGRIVVIPEVVYIARVQPGERTLPSRSDDTHSMVFHWLYCAHPAR